MTFQITIQPAGYRFPAEENETLLAAALRNGYTLPHSCREGSCGVCKGKVLEGKVDHGNYLGHALTEMDRAAGITLFCCATPESDVTVECFSAAKASDIPVRILPCRVRRMTRLADDVMGLQLELPMGERLRFEAGQYISILTNDQRPRNFSLANAPHDNEFLELHVRRIEGGTFTRHVFEGMKERDILRFKGPLGGFRLREGSGKPALFVAGGTGFAPIRSMIEHALHLGLQRPMHLYWGADRPSGLYLPDEIERWKSRGIGFTPVVSGALPEDGWQGRAGLVHQAVLDDFGDLCGHEVYVCGSQPMVEAARRDFIALRGLPEDAFFADAFCAAPAFPSPFQPYQSPF